MYSTTGSSSTSGQSNMTSSITPLYNSVASKSTLADNNKKTTVFIGNISEHTTDEFMHNLMSTCGVIENWKRVLGSNGKYQSFGFCEYQDQEAGLRAMRLLNGFKIGDKLLVVKVDAKTRALLDEYENKNKFQLNKRMTQQKYQMPVSTMTFIRAEQDAKSQNEIDKLIDQNLDLLSGKISSSSNYKTRPISIANEEGQISDDNIDLLTNADNKSFGGLLNCTYMDEDDITYERKRLERKKLEKQKLLKDRLKKWENYENFIADELYHYENKQKRKAKRKNEYEEKLTKFVTMYDDDIDDEKYYKYDLWEEKLSFRNDEMDKDERDALQEEEELKECKKIREKELQEKVISLKIELPMLNSSEAADSTSTKALNEEIKKIKKSSSYNMDVIMVPSAVPVEVEDNIYDTSARLVDEQLPNNSDNSHIRLSLKSYDIPSEIEKSYPSNEIKTKTIEQKQEWSVINGETTDSVKDILKEKKTFGIKLNTSSQKDTSSQSTTSVLIDSGISQLNDTERDDIYSKKKTKLTMITDAEHKEVPLVELPPGYHAESMTPEEKKKRIKKIISSIPTDKDELFAYKVLWDHVDNKLMDERIKPWVSRKIKELIGVEEVTLVEFICTKVFQQSKPQDIVDSISMILENEAEEFTIKLWRFLIYEATAKMYGLNQCSKPLK